jgi:Fur family peroxide stress response transcriptional regulator
MKTKTLNRQKEPLLEAFREKCRRRGISITPQRVAIYSILVDAKNHPTAEDVYEQVKGTFPDISIDTVYRTLSTFCDMGLVEEVEGYGEAKRYDPDVKPHHHFRCKRCKAIVDFQESSFDNLRIPAGISRKYNVANVKVVVEGLCDRCSKGKG